MISCSRTETSSAGVAGKGQGPPARQHCPLIPHHAMKAGFSSGSQQEVWGHRGRGAVWGCASVSITYTCVAVHTRSCTCAHVLLRALWSCYMHACSHAASVHARFSGKLISPFCNHSPRGQGFPWLGTETPVPPPSMTRGWSSIPHSIPHHGCSPMHLPKWVKRFLATCSRA